MTLYLHKLAAVETSLQQIIAVNMCIAPFPLLVQHYLSRKGSVWNVKKEECGMCSVEREVIMIASTVYTHMNAF